MQFFTPDDILTNDRLRNRRIFLLVALALLPHLTDFQGAGACAQPAKVKPTDLIGKRVVQKFGNLTLRSIDRPADRKPVIQSYYVERLEKGWFWLIGQANGDAGWGLPADVIVINEAADYFSRRIKNKPKDAFAYLMRANLRSEVTNEYDLALSDYEQAIRLGPSANAYSGRGRIRYVKKEYDQSIADCTQAIRLDPDSWLAYETRGLARERKKEYDNAIVDFNQAIRLVPGRPDPYSFRGIAWRFKEEYAKAIADYDEAIRLNPDDAGIYSVRGNTWQLMKDYAKAISDFDQAIRLEPGSASNYSYRAIAGYLTGHDTAAAAGMRDALTKGGWREKHSAYYAILGHLAARRAGKMSDARAFLDEMKAKGDTTAWPYPVVRYLLGEIDEKALLVASIDNDKLTESHCYLGLDLLLKKQLEEAKAHLRWVKSFGNRSFNEYAIALAELDRSDAAKPAGAKP